MTATVRRLLTCAVTALTVATLSVVLAAPSFAAHSSTTCPHNGIVTRHLTGHCVPGTPVLDYSWAGGATRTFVVGTDDNVWNIVQSSPGNWSSWRNLGGGIVADYGPVNVHDGGLYDIVIKVLTAGMSGYQCDRLYTNANGAHWTGWSHSEC